MIRLTNKTNAKVSSSFLIAGTFRFQVSWSLLIYGLPLFLLHTNRRPMHWYLKALNQYFDFTGRARRSEYWYFVLFNFIFFIVAAAFDVFYGYFLEIPDWETNWEFFSPLYTLLTFIPALSVTVRRLHEAGYSGWWYLILLLPILGAIWLLVILFQDSERMENKWGPSPKTSKWRSRL